MKKMRFKYLLSLTLAIILTLCGVTTAFSADSSIPILAPGTLYINEDNINFYGYEYRNFKAVIIEEGITDINSGLFYEWSNLQEIYIPASVISIKEDAFYHCENLQRIYYGGTYKQWKEINIEGLAGEWIDDNYYKEGSNTCLNYVSKYYNCAFKDDFVYRFDTFNGTEYASLCRYYGTDAELTLPTEIDGVPVHNIADAFKNITTLKSLTVPVGYKIIASNAFNGCTALESIELPNTITEIGEDAFLNTAYYNDKSNWESSVLYVKNYAVAAERNITRAFIRKETRLISNYLFKSNSNLVSATIYDSKIIGYGAFNGCTNLKAIMLPKSLSQIGNYAFSGCKSLKYMLYCGSVVEWMNVSFDETSNNLLTSASHHYYYSPLHNSYHFYSGLDDVAIVDYIGDETELILPEHTGNEEYKFKTIASGAFAYCNKVESIVLPDSITTVGSLAFSECTALKSITVPSSVTEFSSDAFKNCKALKYVYFKGPKSQWDNLNATVPATTEIIYNYGTTLEGFDYTVNENDSTIQITGYTGKNTNIIIPAEYCGFPIVSIAENALANNTTIKSITVIGTNLEIGDYAFSGCTSLETVALNEGVDCVWANAFEKCTSLKTVFLHNSLSFITYKAFYGCNNIDTVIFSGTQDEWNILLDEIDRGNDPLLNATLRFADEYDGCLVVKQKGETDVVSVIMNGKEMPDTYGCDTSTAMVYEITGTNGAPVSVLVPSNTFDTSLLSLFSINENTATEIEYTFIGNYISFDATDGTYAVCCRIGLQGDTNNDGVTNSLDSNILKRYIAGEYHEVEPYLADANGDGYVNSVDSNLLRRTIAGI